MSKSKIKDTHIFRLTRSKPSGIKIGSRSVPHRLKKFEKAKIQRALKFGWLELGPKDRENLVNVWEKLCIARNQKPWIVEKDLQVGEMTIRDGEKIFYNGPLLPPMDILNQIFIFSEHQ